MASEFGDAEPDDAWDAEDSLADQLDNLRRRSARLVTMASRPHSGAELINRLAMLHEDIAFLVTRLALEGDADG